ncbi:MAG: hypothetical protein F6K23_27730 [Okeania sp. SIO2C9]|uniref:LamG-like jellyroll fold domain-containing protein n=1 Tax=Okeania sp. SIO2C9 TaxID=2607791 RepID=UPI0013C129A0|nr:LamG-like jellyroll fold domain-containing protein [Okeania sp. SIO2C9]NEQ76492.1 hypothetical protein [Okeania sp. SIO2C9]
MLSEHLKLHLKLDDITINADDNSAPLKSAIVKDINGNEIPVFVDGEPKVVEDELFGKCLMFNGGSYFNINNASELHNVNYGFTVSVWAKMMDIADIPNIAITANPSYPTPLAFTDNISSTGTMTQGYNVFVDSSSSKNLWTSSIGKGTTKGWYGISGLRAITDSWTNLTITYDATASNTLYLYINGQEQGQQSTEFVSVTTEKEMRIGASATMEGHGVYYFVGKIADLRIYDRALSDTEVWDMILSSMKIENAEDITNRINNLSNDDLISLLTTMRQEKGLLEEIEYLDDQQREEIASALKEYELDNNWKSMMEIFNIN